MVRAIAADWFRPKAMRALKVRIDELASPFVDRMAEAGGECDFVQEVAVNFPLYVIMSLLGLPESEFPRILKYTQELFGNDDAELQRGCSSPSSILPRKRARMPSFGRRNGVLTTDEVRHPER